MPYYPTGRGRYYDKEAERRNSEIEDLAHELNADPKNLKKAIDTEAKKHLRYAGPQGSREMAMRIVTKKVGICEKATPCVHRIVQQIADPIGVTNKDIAQFSDHVMRLAGELEKVELGRTYRREVSFEGKNEKLDYESESLRKELQKAGIEVKKLDADLNFHLEVGLPVDNKKNYERWSQHKSALLRKVKKEIHRVHEEEHKKRKT